MNFWDAAEQEEEKRIDNLRAGIIAAIDALPEKTAETMAKAAYAAVREACAAEGQNPDIETFIKTPEESHDYLGGTPGVWLVCWEAGPYMWAIDIGMAIVKQTGKLCEPHYGFDLTFYPQEDR